jgi:hypothetical protein
MPTYVYSRERDCMVDKETGLPMLNQEERARPLQTPMTYGDLPGYRSPIDGKWIEGRRARQYDLQSNNCVDAGDMKSPTNGKLKNAKFAAKHNATHLLER